MFDVMLYIALLFISFAMVGLVYRVIKGPSVPDRVIALDGLGINLVATIAILSIILRTSAFLDIILLIGILAFIGTVAFAKYLEKGEIIE
ncbi:Na(+)/H(+) antiporter subunit F1 [Mesobacillus maritimus]|uniref:Na(+)/H(+) antiporter subunit F1 n=1 Tax=Mesobacillus maritimus TaxID=1643336 RepID=UPI00204013A5|nr:Na(+)/H(+) antiporter subunit F1 [Mesobacillus maritimus]MCM3588461.1 Na(+)/H(+) antiporter subunit F1 [Mesobacillus maritimus]MCM3670232.1 Na(+)/H(+) antiporter subunit F1 [Mesobacillus maritimus]